MSDPEAEPERRRAGLCFDCQRCRRVVSDRGSVFYRCLFSEIDPDYAAYPRLPVRQCEAFQPKESPKRC